MTPGQQEAVDELTTVVAQRPGAVEVLSSREDDGNVIVALSLDCRGFDRHAGGIHVRSRERFKITIPSGFPFQRPSVYSRHTRWRNAAHVQWGNYLCLYQAPEAEWNPSDGMYGFLQRLVDWLKAAAWNELDPDGAPVHPPVAYTTSGTPMFVPRQDTPPVADDPWIGFAILDSRSNNRFDIVQWKTLDNLSDDDSGANLALAVLLPSVLPMEYPRRLRPLLDELLNAGVSERLLTRFMWLVKTLGDDEHVHIVVGTPMRGIGGEMQRQHLAVWRITADAVGWFRNSIPEDDDSEELEELRASLRASVESWAETTPVEWCPVRELRPEVTRPRDESSPLRWWSGKTVEVWGCGALGGTIAEHLCRADVGKLVLRDNALVAPGILGRQNFEDGDVGSYKASALAARLKRIRPDLDVATKTTNLTSSPASDIDWSFGADVIFDVTASVTVSKRLEMLRTRRRTSASLVGMMIGHDARRGLVVTSTRHATGGPADAVRKAKIAASRRHSLRAYAEEFWPDPPRSDLFFPEPGCSNPTFTGSDAEVSALASMMLVAATGQLADGESAMTATFASIPSAQADARTVTIPFRPDLVLRDALGSYEVRFAASAVAEVRAWVRRGQRLAPLSETGGVLFGERDDALQLLWVSDVLGPPPDSQASPHGFVCGTDGVDDAAATISTRSRDASRPVGMWHTHPGSAPIPSPTDVYGMGDLVGRDDRSLPKQLLVIVGGTDGHRTIGAYLYDRHKPEPKFWIPRVTHLPATTKPAHTIGLALSGGGFRAVAFHLGVLRALHDRGVLDHVEVLSTVSGGSLIGAMWAYSDDDFATFDRRVTSLLRSGLNGRIARALFISKRTPAMALGVAVSAVTTTAAMTTTAGRWVRSRLRGHPRTDSTEPPRREGANRTSAVQDVFARILGEATITEPKRDVHVIINACDLRSGSAFRFGSVESGCSRYGRLTDNRIPISLAVAASAAYPVALPAIDVEWKFTGRTGEVGSERLLLTDGGVFDNLGTSALEPDRNPHYSTNVHPVDYIVSADAGHGTLDANRYPLWWSGRMKRSFESVYRKVQDTGKGLIYRDGDLNKLEGFVLPFLGQNDSQLRTVVPPDLIRREDVAGYPTNFSAMSSQDVDRLSLRGEQLTRLMIDAHASEIA